MKCEGIFKKKMRYNFIIYEPRVGEIREFIVCYRGERFQALIKDRYSR